MAHCRTKGKPCYRKCAHFFTHIGLIALVVGYSTMGAFLFRLLEDGQLGTTINTDVLDELKKSAISDLWAINVHNQLEELKGRSCSTVCERPASTLNSESLMEVLRREKEKVVRDLWSLTLDLNVLWRDNWTVLAESQLDVLLQQTEVLLRNVADLSNQKPICTVTCEMSAEVTNLTLENWRSRVSERIGQLQDNLTEEVIWQATHGEPRTKWSFSSSFLYALSVITTIGYGHVTPKTPAGKIATICYALVGIPIMLTFLSHTGKSLARFFRLVSLWLFRKCTCKGVEEPPSRISHCSPFSTIKRTRMVEESISPELSGPIRSWEPVVLQTAERLEKHEKASVPIVGCLVIMGGYVFGGAALFTFWEDWLYLDSFYFCFVTLTTIGFGDFIPGASMMSSEVPNDRLIVCCVYVLLGLALIASCFNLMRYQVCRYFRALTRLCESSSKHQLQSVHIRETRHVDL